MKALVVGGAGFIGSHLVDGLIEAGHEVVVFDSLDPQVHGQGRAWPSWLNPGAEAVQGDVRDRDALRAAVCDADAVFYKAAAVGVGQSMYEVRRYVEVNTLGVANLADILANERHRVHKVIVASSMSIYGEGKYRCDVHGSVHPAPRTAAGVAPAGWEVICPMAGCHRVVAPAPTDEETPICPTSIYGITKRDQEEMLLCIGKAHGLPTVALRYFNVYGPRQALSNPYTGAAAIFCSRMLNGRAPLVYEDGAQVRDFVHVRDIVRANLLALERDGADGMAVNIGSGSAMTIADLARTLARHLSFAGEPEITGRFRAGDIRHCFADVTRARTQLGFTAAMSLENGAAQLVDWVSQQLADDRVDEAVSELSSRGLLR